MVTYKTIVEGSTTFIGKGKNAKSYVQVWITKIYGNRKVETFALVFRNDGTVEITKGLKTLWQGSADVFLFLLLHALDLEEIGKKIKEFLEAKGG